MLQRFADLSGLDVTGCSQVSTLRLSVESDNPKKERQSNKCVHAKSDAPQTARDRDPWRICATCLTSWWQAARATSTVGERNLFRFLTGGGPPPPSTPQGLRKCL